MTDKPLIHWGIPGMKWGVRRARAALGKAFGPKTTTKLHTGKDGKTYLVKRTDTNNHLVSSLNRKNKVISKKEVTPQQAKAFMDKQKKRKVKELLKAEQVRAAASITSKVLSAYLVLNTAKMISDLSTPSTSNYNAAYAEWLKNG